MFAPIFSRKKPRQGVLASPLHQEAAGTQNVGNVAPRSHVIGLGLGGGDAQYSNQPYSCAPQAGQMGRRSDGDQQTSNSWQRSSNPTGYGDCNQAMPQTGYARQGNQTSRPNLGTSTGTGRPVQNPAVPYSDQAKQNTNNMTNHSAGQNFQFKRTANNNNKRLQPDGDNQNTAGAPPSQVGPTRPPKLMSVSSQPKRNVAISQQNKQWSQKPAGNYSNSDPWNNSASWVEQTNNSAKPPQNNSRSWGQAPSTSWNGVGATSEPVSWGQPANQEFDLPAPPQRQPHQSVEPHPLHVNSFNNHSKDSKAKAETGIRILPISISMLLLRGKSFHHLPVMFEIIGQLDSAISRDDKTGRRNFHLKDESGVINGSFFEIDRPLPRLTRGRWHRCIGHYDASSQSFKCVSIRPAQESECRARKTTTQQIEIIVMKLLADLRET